MGGRMRVRGWLNWLVSGRENGVRSRVRGWIQSRTIVGRTERKGGATSDPHDPGAGHDSAHTVDGPEGFLFAARSDEVTEDDLMEVTLGGQALLLVRHAEVLRCVSAVCPHAGGALGDGFVEAGHVVCPLHGWTFVLEDGQCSVNPDVRLSCFEVLEEKGRIWVCLDSENTSGESTEDLI
jgi:nitrite reductase (NADH) small subunit